MITSRRIADNPLGFLKDDLLLALRRIHLDLDAYAEDPAQSASLETMIDAVDQIRGPLVALEHREAVTLLEEMRATALERTQDTSAPLHLTLLRQAAEQLSAYLEVYLSPGNRQANSGLLMETATALHQTRQRNLLDEHPAAPKDRLQSSMNLHDVRDCLERLQRTIASKLEKTADQATSWEALQDDLHVLRRMFAERTWTRATTILDRMNRIVDVLAAGAAEHYGVLVSGVCAEILAGFSYSLESPSQDAPMSAMVLNHAQEHLARLDTLLRLPADLHTPLPPTLQEQTSETRNTVTEPPMALPELDLTLPDRSGFTATPIEPPAQPAPMFATESPDLDLQMELSRIDAETSDRVVLTEDRETIPSKESIEEKSEASMDDLIRLIGLADTDPEFAEVFLEEACGELDAIRQQLTLWRADLTDRQALTTIRRAFHTLKGSGRMVNAMVIGDFAWELESLLNQVLDGSRSPSLEIVDVTAAAVATLAPLVGETPLQGGELEALSALATRVRALPQGQPSTTVSESKPTETPVPKPQPLLTPDEPVSRRQAPSARVIAPEIDPEFVEVFLEEARGELQIIRQQVVLWRANFEDRQVLTTLRRAFHTLKGSGRVVGATIIGDFAWCFEDLLNQVINGTRAATPVMAELFDEATTALESLLGEAIGADQALALLPGLTARVEALAQELPVIAPIAERPEMATPAPTLEPVIHEIPALPTEAQPTEVAIPALPTEAQPTEVAIPALPTEVQPAEVAPPTLSEEIAPAPVVIPLPVVSEIPPHAIHPETAVASPSEPTSAAPVDLELARAFQYEATEILDASDTILQQLSDDPTNTSLLNDLRRGMHTLKGSSRMTGLMAVGDLAHAAESVLDTLGKGIGQVTPVVLDTLQQTLDRLNRMLTEAANGMGLVAAVDLIQDLHRLAETIAVSDQAKTRSIGAPESVSTISEPLSFRAMTELDQELIQVFQAEASEVLDSSDVILRRLSEEPGNTELLNDLRREMHTLKGSSRMAGFMTVGDVAHAAESILDALGKGTLEMSALVLDKIQSALDSLHQMLTGILGGEQPPARQALIDELHGVLGGKPAERIKPLTPTLATAMALTAAPTSAPMARPTAKQASAAGSSDTIRVSATLLNTLVNQMGESSIFRARIDQGVSAMNFNLNELEQTISRLRRQVTHLSTQAEARIQSRQDQDAKAHQQDFDPLELDRFTELQQLSRSLMEIADDLGNIGNTLGEHSREVTTLLDQQGKVNKEIQQGLMRTGMVRFGSIIPRLRRVVRQAAQDLGKRAELLVGGEEAEVDRTVLDSMLAPLEHMLRNSLAHGIELPDQRRAAGKPEIGTITLSLRREGAEQVLELGDDGAGLNFDIIRAKGEEKGMLAPGQPATQEELIALLLRPGFSTATSVTQVSGRGVGMDVVNEAIRAMRGALLVQTEPGQGTRFIVRLPFSLAVTQALLVQVGDGVFAIPLLSIEVVTRLKESEFQAYLTGEQVLHQYSDRRYPVHNLGILVGSDRLLPFEEVKDRRPPTLLFRSAEASAALQVEAVLGNQEIIVKPTSPQFNGVPGISGATVLGDGRVVVVLELAALVRNIGSQRQKQAESRALRMARQETRQEKLNIMVIDDSITMRKVTARILERHNIHAITAKDGMDAVAMLQTQVPDLAILDIEMPRMDGFEVVAHVRNQIHLRHLPIIMVTSRGGDKHRDRAMNLGVNAYLTKPYQEEQLMDCIRNILGERALELIA
ncbi:MAG: Hpt domain-containing protein [Gammaproteobacteria bacterium]|nr:Hpt domain-containing protein [Gammaproteobacteria bacterium]MCP5196562.1 Hpt domain-containing protein [Gammaproteobacteria bacterium]